MKIFRVFLHCLSSASLAYFTLPGIVAIVGVLLVCFSLFVRPVFNNQHPSICMDKGYVRYALCVISDFMCVGALLGVCGGPSLNTMGDRPYFPEYKPRLDFYIGNKRTKELQATLLCPQV